MVRCGTLDTTVKIVSNERAVQEYADNDFDERNDKNRDTGDIVWVPIIRLDDQAIRDNPDGQEEGQYGFWPRTIKIQKYIECETGDVYKIRLRWGEDMPFKDDDVRVEVQIDGFFADSFYAQRKHFAKEGVYTHESDHYRKRQKQSGMRKGDPYRYAELTITDAEANVEKVFDIGSIRLLFFRVHVHGWGFGKSGGSGRGYIPSAHHQSYPENALKKGGAVSHGTDHGTGKDGGNPPFPTVTYKDAKPSTERTKAGKEKKLQNRHPFLDICFKYRRRISLQALGVMPRDAPIEEVEDEKAKIQAARNRYFPAARISVIDQVDLTDDDGKDDAGGDVVFLRSIERRAGTNNDPIDLLEDDAVGSSTLFAAHPEAQRELRERKRGRPSELERNQDVDRPRKRRSHENDIFWEHLTREDELRIFRRNMRIDAAEISGQRIDLDTPEPEQDHMRAEILVEDFLDEESEENRGHAAFTERRWSEIIPETPERTPEPVLPAESVNARTTPIDLTADVDIGEGGIPTTNDGRDVLVERVASLSNLEQLTTSPDTVSPIDLAGDDADD